MQNKIYSIMADCYANDYNPKEIGNILKVIKDKGYTSAQDLMQFAERGMPIVSWLLDYYNKIYDTDASVSEFYNIIRGKQVSYQNIIDTLKYKGYKNIEL